MLHDPLYDYNGILDPGEDQNGNNRLDPGNIASVTAAIDRQHRPRHREHRLCAGLRPLGHRQPRGLCQRPEGKHRQRPGDPRTVGSGGRLCQRKDLAAGSPQSVRDIDDLLRGYDGDAPLLVPDGTQLATIPDRGPLPCVPERDQHREHHANHLYRFGPVARDALLLPDHDGRCGGGRITVRGHDLQCDLCPAPVGAYRHGDFSVPDPALLECPGRRDRVSRLPERGLSHLKDVVSTSTLDSGLAPNTLYCYAVSGNDAAGGESPKSIQMCATTQMSAPPTPTGLTAAGREVPPQVTLTWNASAGATKYNIYRDGGVYGVVGQRPGGDGARHRPESHPPGLNPQTNYCYTISAENVSGNESEQSTQVCTATGGAVMPSPTGLTATLLAGPQVRLNWNASAGATGYRIYRNGTATLVSGATTVTDATVSPEHRVLLCRCRSGRRGQRIAEIGAGLHRHGRSGAADAVRPVCRGGAEPAAGRPDLELIDRRRQLPDLPERRDDPHPVAHGGAGNGYDGGGFDPLLLHHLRREQLRAANRPNQPFQPASRRVRQARRRRPASTATGTAGPPPRVTLTWTTSLGAAGYRIYRDGTLISPTFTRIAGDRYGRTGA